MKDINKKKIVIISGLMLVFFVACRGPAGSAIPAGPVELAESWSVIYDKNGATTGDEPVTRQYTKGSFFIIERSGILQRTGYAFIGWNTKKNGRGRLYRPGTSYKMEEADMTLYAMWKMLTGRGSWVSSLATGYSHVLVAKVDGTLLALGYFRRDDGPVGGGGSGTGHDGDLRKVAHNVRAVAANAYRSYYITNDNKLMGLGDIYFSQIHHGKSNMGNNNPIEIASDVDSVSTGLTMTMFIKHDGTLWSMGSNYFGQLGFPKDSNTVRYDPIQIASGIKAVSAGRNFVMVLKRDGTLWTAGNNRYGQLGQGAVNKKEFGLAEVTELGDTSWKIPTSNLVQIMDGVSSISAGEEYGMALKTDETLWGWGENVDGQLGDGTTISRNSPRRIDVEGTPKAVFAGYYATVVQVEQQQPGHSEPVSVLYATGSNGHGELGDGTYIARNRLNRPVLYSSGPVGSINAVASGKSCITFVREGKLFVSGVRFAIGIPNEPKPVYHIEDYTIATPTIIQTEND